VLSVICGWISSITYSFGDKLNQKRPSKRKIPKFELSYFLSNFIAVFCKMIIFMGC
jgi:hypothetical protein